MKRTANLKRTWEIGALALLLSSSSGCSTLRSFFATDSTKDAPQPIKNPFGDYQTDNSTHAVDPTDTMIFRSKRGDNAVEVEIPRANQGVTDFVLPIPQSRVSRSIASSHSSIETASSLTDEPTLDDSYRKQAPTMADREITRSLAQSAYGDESRQREVEQGLGLTLSDEPSPEREHSYLASMDHAKQLYRVGRYEVALVEVDSLIRDYPTDPKLFQMRGTLLDRLGKTDMAVHSWNQALRLEPKNETLRRFLDKRTRQPAGVQSP